MHWEPIDVFYTRVEDCQRVGSVGTKKFRECETRNTGAESAESGAICWRSRPALILLSRGTDQVCTLRVVWRNESTLRLHQWILWPLALAPCEVSRLLWSGMSGSLRFWVRLSPQRRVLCV